MQDRDAPQPSLADPIAARRRAIGIDLIVAVAVAAVLTIGWSITQWPRLERLLLPDPDDMMRLAQVRDWIAGQGINDWTQYRVAPPHGAPMHWSRLNDIGIAAIILGSTPFVGRHSAELIAVLTYPALLFACAMFLSARIGRRLWGPQAGPIAAILTGLAYPGTTVFIPGRIDHHALQVVLIQLFVLALMRGATLRTGIAAGVVAALSLVVGLETAPQVAALIAVMALCWVARGEIERDRLLGFAGGLAATTVIFLVALRPTYWTAALCDAFTPASTTGTLATAAALAVLALGTPLFPDWRARLVAGGVLGAVAIGATLLAFPSCINGPYGEMSQFLRIAFLPHIDEANGIAAQTNLARAISIGGMLAVAAVVSLWMLARDRRRWAVLAPIVAVVVVSALVILAQVRGAYIGAPLGSPVLAGLVVAARKRTSWQVPAVIAAWLAGAGLAHLELPKLIEQVIAPGTPPAAPTTPQQLCNSGDAWAQVDRFPPGTVMAATSMASYLVGATHHATIGAGYHRNNVGNMAMYRFFLSNPDAARAIGRQWRTDYVAFCPGDFDEIGVASTYPDSLAADLRAGRPPAWLRELPLRDARLRFYRIVE